MTVINVKELPLFGRVVADSAATSLLGEHGSVSLCGNPVGAQQSPVPAVLGVPRLESGFAFLTMGDTVTTALFCSAVDTTPSITEDKINLGSAGDTPASLGIRVDFGDPMLGGERARAFPFVAISLDGDDTTVTAVGHPIAGVDVGQNMSDLALLRGVASDVADGFSFDPPSASVVVDSESSLLPASTVTEPVFDRAVISTLATI